MAERFRHFKLSVKRVYLLLIAVISLCLIICKRDGLDFGIIALVCWIFAFLDLARIKLKDYEIEFMSSKQVLTADERKLFMDNYDLVSQFQTKYWQKGCVDKETLDLIFKAYCQAELYLPEDIVSYLLDITDKATQSFSLHLQLENTEVGKTRTELVKREKKINETFQTMKPVTLYRRYMNICVKNKTED